MRRPAKMPNDAQSKSRASTAKNLASTIQEKSTSK